MTDEEFIEAFEQGNLEEFKHIDHIRMAWIYFTTRDPAMALERIVSGIKHFAAVKNATGLYHETITLFWISAVFNAAGAGDCASFYEFVSENTHLTQKEHLFEYYSRELVLSDRARAVWVAPDLQPLNNRFSHSQSLSVDRSNLYAS